MIVRHPKPVSEARLKRFPAILALCLPLLACAERAPQPPAGFLRAQAAPPTAAARAVEVTIMDIPPGHTLERVVLIDPQGGRHPAERLEPVTREGGTAAPGARFGIGVSGGSSSGVKPALSLGLGTGLKEQTYRSRRVLARVPLPDVAAFRTHPKRWRLEVTYLDVTGARRSLVLPVR
jgi:hypothetical protein